MGETFVSEQIVPVAGTMDPRSMARGDPGFPEQFRWRGDEYRLDRILETWKETGPCTYGGDEQYVRKHWFRILTVDGREMKIYYERQARSGRERKKRWWLFTIGSSE